MADQGQENYLYYPTEDCISVSSQAKRAGLNYKVYISPKVWSFACAWHQIAMQEARIEDLLQAFQSGLYKKLCTTDSFVSFDFYCWAKRRWKPKSKAVKAKLRAHVFMNPEEERPWILIFDPELDRTQHIIRKEEANGQPEADRRDGRVPGEHGSADDSGMDEGSQDQCVQNEAE